MNWFMQADGEKNEMNVHLKSRVEVIKNLESYGQNLKMLPKMINSDFFSFSNLVNSSENATKAYEEQDSVRTKFSAGLYCKK